MRYRPVALALLLVTALPAAGQAAEPSPLEGRIAERLRRFDGLMGVAAVHLESGEAAFVEADRRFPTASAIKVAVMVEAYHRLAEGSIRKQQLLALREEDKVGGSGVLRGLRAGTRHSVGDLLYLMMAVSDNTATNMLIGLLGTLSVNRRLEGLGLTRTRLYRPTFRGGRADAFPEEEREFGLGSSTPREMARLLELIARGRVVSAPASAEMMELLAEERNDDMLPRLLPAEGVRVHHKTGTDEEKLPDPAGRRGGVRVDAGIVSTPRGRYVAALFARRVRDDRWSADNEALVTGAEVSRMLYEHFLR